MMRLDSQNQLTKQRFSVIKSSANNFSLLCIILLFAIGSIEAKTYSGRVVDSETQTGVEGVSVIMQNSDVKEITDENGDFSFSAEISVKPARPDFKKHNLIKWNATAHAFDLKSAPQVKSVAIYNLKGEQLFFKDCVPGIEMVCLPPLSRNTYLLRIVTQSEMIYFTIWTYRGNGFSFSFGEKIRQLSGRISSASGLVFEKQGYQTKQVDIKKDSTYTSMTVKLKPEIGSCIFDEDKVRTYKLYLTDENMEKLLDYNNLVRTPYVVNSVFVQAGLEVEGRTLDSIGVRFRGDQSLWDCVSNGVRKKNVSYPQFGFGNTDICVKFSMKFDFNMYDSEKRLFGLKSLNFRSMSADPTKMHEKLGFALFNDMGVAAPRIAYAKLYVNDSLWGLFSVAEEIDGRFTKWRHPGSGDGNLYKALWPEISANDEIITEALSTNNDPEDNTDISDFREFRDSVTADGTTAENILEKCKMIVDIPQLVRYIVVDRGIMNFDGIMSCYTWNGGHMRHNYCWYHDTESGLFRLIPWDLDKILIYPEPNFWTNNEPGADSKVPNWNVVNSTYTTYSCSFDPGSGGGTYNVESIDNDKFLRLIRNATWNDFCDQGKIFLDTVFTKDKIDKRIETWRTLIAGAVGEDPTIDSAEWSVMVDSLSHSVPLFRKNLEMMIDTLMWNFVR